MRLDEGSYRLSDKSGDASASYTHPEQRLRHGHYRHCKHGFPCVELDSRWEGHSEAASSSGRSEARSMVGAGAVGVARREGTTRAGAE